MHTLSLSMSKTIKAPSHLQISQMFSLVGSHLSMSNILIACKRILELAKSVSSIFFRHLLLHVLLYLRPWRREFSACAMTLRMVGANSKKCQHQSHVCCPFTTVTLMFSINQLLTGSVSLNCTVNINLR